MFLATLGEKFGESAEPDGAANPGFLPEVYGGFYLSPDQRPSFNKIKAQQLDEATT